MSTVPRRTKDAANTATIAAIAGALGSLAFTLYFGRHNQSLVLVALFAVWVTGPFLGLILTRARTGATLAVTLGSLAYYGFRTAYPPKAQAASTFLMVPLVAWIIVAIAAFVSRKSANST